MTDCVHCAQACDGSVMVTKEAARIRAERARRNKPNISDFLGYGLKIDPTPMTTSEYMAEIRDGEQS